MPWHSPPPPPLLLRLMGRKQKQKRKQKKREPRKRRGRSGGAPPPPAGAAPGSGPTAGTLVGAAGRCRPVSCANVLRVRLCVCLFGGDCRGNARLCLGFRQVFVSKQADNHPSLPLSHLFPIHKICIPTHLRELDGRGRVRGLEEAHVHLPQLRDQQGAFAGVAEHAGGGEVVPGVLCVWRNVYNCVC